MRLSEGAKRLLQMRLFAVLATTNEDGTIHQSVVWCLLEGDSLIMNTKVGRVKYENIKRNPSVSVCIHNEYQYVTIKGKVELIDDPEIAQADIHRLAFRYEGGYSAQKQVRDTFSKEARVTLRLKCEQVSVYWGSR